MDGIESFPGSKSTKEEDGGKMGESRIEILHKEPGFERRVIVKRGNETVIIAKNSDGSIELKVGTHMMSTEGNNWYGFVTLKEITAFDLREGLDLLNLPGPQKTLDGLEG